MTDVTVYLGKELTSLQTDNRPQMWPRYHYQLSKCIECVLCLYIYSVYIYVYYYIIQYT